jgi:iron complex outermembrane recepter protein
MTFPRFKLKLTHVASLLLLFTMAGEGLAQTSAAPADGSGQRAPGTLSPVQVRADPGAAYRPAETQAGVLGDLDPLSTPFSVNSITRDLIVNQQASYLGDFLKNDPSASVGNVVISFGTLRGFSLGSSGFLFDGLQLGSLLLDGRTSLDAFERVDVLKGASAFLTGLGGASSLGGVINYVPKTALGGPVRDVYLQYGNSAQVGVGADLGGRFGAGEAFGLRVNASARDGETAVDDMNWRQNALALSGDWRVNRDLSLQAGFYHVANDYRQMPPFFIGVGDALGNPIPVPSAPDTSKNFTPSWNRFNQEADIGWLRGDWAFSPDWKLTAQYGYGVNERPYGADMDSRYGSIGEGGSTLLFASQESSRIKAQSGQALVHGKFATGTLRHELTFGASTAQERNYGSFVGAGVAPGSLYEPNNTPQPPLAPFDVLPYSGKTKTSGLIVSDIVHFDERWSVLLGGRQARLDSYGPDNAQLPGGSISKFTPTVAAMFKPTPSSLVYANYAQGLEPGGTAPAGTSNVGAILPAQVTKQYEIGGKLDLGRMLLTAALFDMRRPLQSRSPSNAWVQEGEQTHRGLELLASGSVTPDLRLVAGAMYLDAKQKNPNDPAADGNRVAGVPRWTANAWAEYRVGAVPGLFLNAGVYYASLQYFDNANLQSIPSWTRFDVGGRYETKAAGYPLSLLLTVENVADRHYWQSALGSALTLGDPLTVKATARMSF